MTGVPESTADAAREPARPETLTVTLTTPIEAHGETASTLTLRAPKIGKLGGVHLILSHTGELKFDLGDSPRLIAAMAGIPPSAAQTISSYDLLLFMPAVLDFLGLVRRTGRGPSRTSPGSSAGRPPN